MNDTPGVGIDSEPYRTSIDIEARPSVVFEYLTDARKILTWMGDYSVLDARPGGEFTLNINGIPVRGHYLSVESPERVVFTWGHAGSSVLPPASSVVTISLTPTEFGTRLELEHSQLPPEEAPLHAIGWPHFLGRLAVAASGRAPAPHSDHPVLGNG